MAIIPLPVGPTCFSEKWRPENSFRSGGAGATGSEQLVGSPTGRWRAQMQFHCTEPDHYTEVDGFLAALDGSANTMLIGPVDWRGRPWKIDPLTGGLITPDKAAFDNTVSPAFGTNADTRGDLLFTLNAAVPVNATTLAIKRTRGGLLRRGQHLSLGNRLHIITALTSADDGAVDTVVNVTIRPWTRLAYASGTVCEFAAPLGEMRLAPEAVAALERNTTPLSDLALDLIEAF